jgi:hypothetical protein
MVRQTPAPVPYVAFSGVRVGEGFYRKPTR